MGARKAAKELAREIGMQAASAFLAGTIAALILLVIA